MVHGRFQILIRSCVLAVGVLTCTPSEQPDELVVARVNGELVTGAEFEGEIARLPKVLQERYKDPDQRARFLDQVIDRRLMRQAAKQRGIHEDPEIRRKLDDMEQRLLVDAFQRAVAAEAVTDDAIRAYYDENRAEYTDERVRVRHILVHDEATARDLLGDLRAGADFMALAREHSVDPTANKGGDLGYVARGRMDPAFEAVAFGLTEPGEISGVVRTRFGYHLLQLVGTAMNRTRPYEQAKLSIRQKLERAAVRRSLEELRSGASIQVTLPQGSSTGSSS